MSAYKRQHFLPCAYLKNFSQDGPTATRKSQVWRVARQRCVLVSVETQCAEDFLFSKAEPQKTEEMFQVVEGAYGEAMKKIWDGGRPTTFEFFALILAMFELYARNAIHENLTGLEGVEAYKLRLTTLVNQLLLGHAGPAAASEEQVWSYLKQHWQVRLLRSPGGEVLTSDNPSHWFNWEGAPTLHFVLLPVTPTIYAIAYDQRFTRVLGDRLSEGDGALLTQNQVLQCGECVFASTKPSDHLVDLFRAEWIKRPPPTASTGLEKWDLNILQPPREDILSFVRRI